jgi:hypothetical protein
MGAEFGQTALVPLRGWNFHLISFCRTLLHGWIVISQLFRQQNAGSLCTLELPGQSVVAHNFREHLRCPMLRLVYRVAPGT